MTPKQSTNLSTLGRSKWMDVLNVIIPILLTLLCVFVALEIGFRVFYQTIPLEVCASDPIVANYYCKPYFRYDKPIRIAYRYRPGFKEWSAIVPVTFCMERIPPGTVINVLDEAGRLGVGDWRPSAPRNHAGMYGRFQVDFDRIEEANNGARIQAS